MLTTEIARTLEKKLGLGEFPMVRRRLYSRLQRVAVAKGDLALLIISEALLQADALRDRQTGGPATLDSKGRWFAKVVVLRLKEQGYWDDPQHPAGQAAPPPPPAPSEASEGLPLPPPNPAPLPPAPIVQQLNARIAKASMPPLGEPSEAELQARREAYWAQVKAMDYQRFTRKGGAS